MQTFEVGSSAHVQTKTICDVVVFSDYQRSFPVPKNSIDIDDLVGEWEQDPEHLALLSAARVRFARKTTKDDDTSIRALRLRAGLSQASLAKAIGTSQPHIARLEGGSAEPSLETCRKLSTALQVDLNTIDRAFPRHGGAD